MTKKKKKPKRDPLVLEVQQHATNATCLCEHCRTSAAAKNVATRRGKKQQS